MVAASSLMGFPYSSRSSTPLADALEGKVTETVRGNEQGGGVERRHVPATRAWSPPVPAGLPPGYKGSLRADGNTDVPERPPPGEAH